MNRVFIYKGVALNTDNNEDAEKIIKNGGVELRECPAYTLLYQFSPKDTGQSKVK